MRKLDSVDSTLAAEVVADALSAVTKQSAGERGEVARVEQRGRRCKGDSVNGDLRRDPEAVRALHAG